MIQRRSQFGLTMIELLIVITILAALATAFFFVARTQISRSRDAQRKTDLKKIKVAFEDYFNDTNCYPPAGTLDNCGASFAPYLNRIPCDPTTDQPYVYLPEANACTGYRVLSRLENPTDGVAYQDSGCATSCGCGLGAAYESYTYGVSSGVPVTGDTSSCTPLIDLTLPGASSSPGAGGGGSPTASPQSSGTPNPVYVYACDTNGVCNQYEEPGPAGCTTFPTINLCNSACQTDPDTYECSAAST